MAVIDSLLGLVESQQALGLVVAAGEAPQLVLADGQRALSMPAIAADTVAAMMREVGGGRHYETRGGGVFEVRVEGEGPSLRLTFSRGAAGPAAHPTEPASSGPAPGRSAIPGHMDARLLDLLGRLERERASDLLLSSGLPPRLRAGGLLRELEGPLVDDAELLALLEPAMDARARDELEARGSVDLALEVGDGPGAPRFRVNLFRQQRGLAAALRPIRRDPPSLRELNLPERLADLADFANGLVLVTGPSGSGKSTTLVALTECLNQRASKHVVTLEDPIEYAFTSGRSLVHQREVGRHVHDFASGLRAALRESPDVIVVGEMRDRETIAAALTAAETGHLVLATLHSANPWMAIDRMIDVFPGAQQQQVRTQLAVVLRAVLSQVLLESNAPPLRVPACELLVMTGAAANQIRDDKTHQLQSTIQTGREDGMVSLEASLAALVRAGRLDASRARPLVRDARLFEELLERG